MTAAWSTSRYGVSPVSSSHRTTPYDLEFNGLVWGYPAGVLRSCFFLFFFRTRRRPSRSRALCGWLRAPSRRRFRWNSSRRWCRSRCGKYRSRWSWPRCYPPGGRCNAKVNQLTALFGGVGHHLRKLLGAFQIAVNDFMRVEVVHSGSDLDGPVEGETRW